jgi:hypothetical protein
VDELDVKHSLEVHVRQVKLCTADALAASDTPRGLPNLTGLRSWLVRPLGVESTDDVLAATVLVISH